MRNRGFEPKSSRARLSYVTTYLAAALISAFLLFGCEGGTGSNPRAADTISRSLDPLRGDPTPPDCPSAKDGYPPSLVPDSGPSDTSVTVVGAVPMFGNAGQYIPTERVTIWWNVDPERWPTVLNSAPVAESPTGVEFLGEGDVSGRCGYELKFQVPDSPAGRYSVIVLHHGKDMREAARFPPATFEVTE
jgi:hypothetical protein